MPNRKKRILIVEDEAAIRSGLVDVLIYHGYETDEAMDGYTGLRKALSGLYDLILLDVMLPQMDGFEVCRQIREADREQPVIMLTARSSDDDFVHGLRLGADDYVAKPFSVAQLVLRIEAVLRRSGGGENGLEKIYLEGPDGYRLKVDVANLSAKKSGAPTIAFTRREMDVISYLYVNHERPVPREELLTRVWGYARDLDLETRTVDIHIAKIRRKIEPDASKPILLITVRGAGYRLLLGELADEPGKNL
ncbi:MAG: response regulator transcription factor [Gammaproteobacteria bacterium]|nr:response regulator transcription factor [Gammaproteobacteria bacterium]